MDFNSLTKTSQVATLIFLLYHNRIEFQETSKIATTLEHFYEDQELEGWEAWMYDIDFLQALIDSYEFVLGDCIIGLPTYIQELKAGTADKTDRYWLL